VNCFVARAPLAEANDVTSQGVIGLLGGMRIYWIEIQTIDRIGCVANVIARRLKSISRKIVGPVVVKVAVAKWEALPLRVSSQNSILWAGR
jgi:hypothetical protein